MTRTKSFSEFNAKDWKNFGLYITFLGLLIIFVGKQFEVGLGFFLLGFVFTILTHGTKVFKIIKELVNLFKKQPI